MMKPDRETTTHADPAGLRTGRVPRTMRRLRIGDERGQAVTEFAMVVPLFAVLVVVCILFGKAIYAYIQLTHTANEGARLAAVNQPQGGTTLCSFLSSEGALPSGVTLTISYPDNGGARTAGNSVTVQASASGSWVPIISLGSITSSATMRLEQDTTGNSELDTTPCSS
jgi:TadE-like protein